MYSHIHNHSVGSLLDGLIQPADLVRVASEMGFPAVGLSDHGSISSAVKFYKACKLYKIKGIVGIEAYFVDDNTKFEKGEVRYHICLFAKNSQGIKNIFKMMTEAHQFFYYKPRIDINTLEKYSEGVIVTSACEHGLAAHPNNNVVFKIMKGIFGDSFFLEVMPINTEGQKNISLFIKDYHKTSKIPVIASNDIHYLKPEDEKVHNFLLNLNTKGGLKFNVSGLYMKTEKEMIEGFEKLYGKDSFWNYAVDNVQSLVDQVEDDIMQESDLILPDLGLADPYEELEKRVMRKLPNRDNMDRIRYELDLIKEKGYAPYFLMVSDMVDWAKREGFELGAGRGSAGGSLVCYVLGITDIDPIYHGLMFERFLNPDRVDWPDIDLDFPRSRRGEIVKYLKDRYGDDCVANISTVSELKTTSAFKDVARSMGVSFFTANQLSKQLDNEKSFKESLDDNSVDITPLKKENINIPELITYVDSLRGTWRHSGKHAAGVVISPQPLVEYGVLERRKDDNCFNWDMDDINFFGLVKIDVLGLRTLDIIHEARRLIKKHRGIEIDWKTTKVDLPEILDEFAKGNTVGLFQFESYNMTSLLKRLGKIKDKFTLIDMNALGRPGTLDSGITDLYIRIYNGEEVTMPLYQSLVDHVTGDTFGLIVYQEQIIKILVDVAGYTPAQADTLRRIFAKVKGPAEMEKDRGVFVDGCVKTSNTTEEVANKLFDDLVAFGRYGFNKSHAAAYTELALRQAWLKFHYPLEYLAALYTWTDEEDKVSKFGTECARLGVELLPPDINESDIGFTVTEKGIRIGFGGVKGVGEKACKNIIKQRNIKPFASIEDFRIRVLKKQANKTVFTNLILAGAFDRFKINQKVFWDNRDKYNDLESLPLAEVLRLYDTEDDFTEQEKHKFKMLLLPGIYKVNMQPECGLNLDEESLKVIRDTIRDCDWCQLRRIYNCPVAPEYSPTSSIMIIAEAPGEDEVAEGRPLIGRAGKLLMKVLEGYGITREDCYMTNLWKCRPLKNKLPDNPPKDCFEIIKSEIRVLKPKLILALGRSAMWFITGEKEGISKLAGTCSVEIIQGEFVVPVVYSIHPAALLYPGSNSIDNRLLFDLAIRKVAEIFWGEKENENN